MGQDSSEFPELVELGSNHSPLSVWLKAHSAGQFWKSTYAPTFAGLGHGVAARIIIENRQAASLLQNYPASRWRNACNGFGWTPVSASLLSWCAGALLDEVLEYWRAKELRAEKEVGFDFAALLINPQILPAPKLTDIFRAGRDEIGVQLILASTVNTIDIDILAEKMANLPPDLKYMINARSK